MKLISRQCKQGSSVFRPLHNPDKKWSQDNRNQYKHCAIRTLDKRNQVLNYTIELVFRGCFIFGEIMIITLLLELFKYF